MPEKTDKDWENEKFLEPKVEILMVEINDKQSPNTNLTEMGTQPSQLLNGNPINDQCSDTSFSVVKNDGGASTNCWKKYFGLILTFVSTFVLSINQIAIKMLTKEMHPFNMGIWTFSVSILLSLPFLVYRKRIKKKPSLDILLPVKNHPKLVSMMVIRAIISPIAFVLLFYAFENLEIGDTVVIISSAPIFVYLLGWLFLGEKIGVVIILSSLLAVAGVIVIVRPPILTGKETLDENLLVGIIFAVLSMMSMSISFVIVRLLKGVYHGILTVTSNTTGTLVSILLSVVSGVFQWPKSSYQAILFLSIAFLSLLGQTLLIVALRFEQAGPVSLLRTSGVILAFIWQLFVFGKIPDILSLVGAGMIATGVVVIILRKWLYDLPKENLLRKRFAILLI